MAILGTVPAQALTAGLTVDDFSGGGPSASRTTPHEGAGSVNIGSGTATVSVVGDHGVSATISWAFDSAQDLTAGGAATQLELDYSSVTSSNPNQLTAAALFQLTVTDTSGSSSTAYGSVGRGQTASVAAFGNVAGGLQGSADLTRVKSMTITWTPGQAVDGGTISNTVSIDKIWSLNPNTVEPQSIQFTSTAPTNATVGGSYDATTTAGGSSQPVVFAVGSATTNAACTVTSAGHVSFKHVGTCVVTANQAGDPSHEPAPEVTQSIPVGKGGQSISISSSPPATGAIDGTYAVVATGGGSGSAVVVSVGSGTTNGACTVSGSTVTFKHAGTCVIAVDQAGSADYTAAAQKTQTVTVQKSAQSISFTSTPPSPASIDGTYAVAASGGGSSSAVTFSVGSGTTNGACTVSGSTVSFAHAGTCVVAADQAGDADHDAAAQKTQTITVQKNAQAITFTSTPPDPAYVGNHYEVLANGGGSSNDVTFSTTSAACSVAGDVVTFLAAGDCSIDADQAGTADYAAAPTVTQLITVTKVTSTVTVEVTPSATVYGQQATATATVVPAVSQAAGTVQFQVDGTGLGSPVDLAGGTASVPLPDDLAAGASHQVTATFTPIDTTMFANAEGSGALPVGQADTGTAVTVTAHALTATVTATPPGGGVPTGTVQFMVNGVAVGLAPVDGSGVATLDHTVPTGRSNAVAAAYSGDPNFLPSSGSTARNDPTISATVRATPHRTKWGWYRGRVTVSFTCTTSGSPLTGACPGPVTIGRQGAGRSVSRTITAADGGIGTASVSGINIDRHKPRVRIKGLRSGGQYLRAPKVRCKGTDKLSGLASCHVKRKKLKNHRIRYIAIAKDKAGNKARRRVTISLQVQQVSVMGLAAHRGAYDVRAGGSYTLVVVGGPRPRYVNAAPVPQQPHGLSLFFHRIGTVAGKPRWAIGVTMSSAMAGRTWNLGVLQGGELRVVKVRVH